MKPWPVWPTPSMAGFAEWLTASPWRMAGWAFVWMVIGAALFCAGLCAAAR